MDPALLRAIDEELGEEDIAALKFLCIGHIQGRKLADVREGLDLFRILEDQAMLEDGGLFLKEMLDTIGRRDLGLRLEESCKQAGRPPGDQTQGYKIAPYRKMLYELSENVTEECLKTMRFLLKMPPGIKQRCTTFPLMLVEMEKLGLLAEDNLTELERICSYGSKKLSRKLQYYITGENVNASPGVRNSTDENEAYDMSHRPRGHCLIINNYSFQKARENGVVLRDRGGTEFDERSLTSIFSELHFEVRVERDLAKAAILEAVGELGKLSHREMNAFVCCVLTHGKLGGVYGTDGQLVSIRSITWPFTSSQCPSLATKPKIFFIQACQGQNKQQAVSLQADGREEHCEVDEGGFLSDSIPDTVPNESDFLVSMATVEDCMSFRSTTQGSIFIQELCRQLRRGCDSREDILAILTRVNGAVSKGIYLKAKQMPEPRYTLTKKLVLAFS